jgi:hypothetical protein
MTMIETLEILISLICNFLKDIKFVENKLPGAFINWTHLVYFASPRPFCVFAFYFASPRFTLRLRIHSASSRPLCVFASPLCLRV